MAEGSDWYYSQHEPERERNNKFVGFLILVAFILACIFTLTFIAEHFGTKNKKAHTYILNHTHETQEVIFQARS